MDAKQFNLNMQKILQIKSVYQRHIEADALMCSVLTQLGYGEGVLNFLTMEKWYNYTTDFLAVKR